MKALLLSLAVAALLCLAPIARAQVGPVEDFQQTLSQATLSIYQGKQVCGYKPIDTFFGTFNVWQCGFARQFTCTATVIARESEDTYVGLSAGHCVDWSAEKDYYVSTTVEKEPVLHSVNIIKAENDDRYDFMIFEFRSMKELPVIAVSMKGHVPALGTKVLNINFAMGVGKHFSRGEVTSEPLDSEVFGAKERFMANIEGAPGASGSSVVDLNTHEIIGLCEFGFNRGNLGMGVIPTGQRLADFLDDDSAGIKPLPEPKTPPAGAVQNVLSKFAAIIRKIFFYSIGL